MPYKSKAQAAYFNIHRRELESQGVNVDEWNSASKGMKLPKKVKKKADGGKVDDPLTRMIKEHRRNRLGEELGGALSEGIIPPEMLYLQKGIDPSGVQGDSNAIDPRYLGGQLPGSRFPESYAEGGPAQYSYMPQGRYGKHGIDLSIPLNSNTDITGRAAVSPELQSPSRSGVDARIGIRRRFADGGSIQDMLNTPISEFNTHSDRLTKGWPRSENIEDYRGLPPQMGTVDTIQPHLRPRGSPLSQQLGFGDIGGYADGGATFDMPDIPPEGDEPVSPLALFRRGMSGGLGAANKYLGIPQDEIRNRHGDVVFPTNALERGLQRSDAPTKEVGASFLGGGGGGSGPGAYQGMFVGPYGAMALRNRATTPTQLRALEHPVVRAARDRGEEPWLGITDPAKRDEVARDLLEYRRQAGDPRDEDIWRGSGWFRGEEGAAKKEIPDIGARLQRIDPRDNKFRLEHPAGDLHDVYDIPHITAQRDLMSDIRGASASVNPKTAQITINSMPSDRTRMRRAVSDALHEVGHVIQNREGWATGSNPMMAMKRPPFEQELGRPFSREIAEQEKLPIRFQKEMPPEAIDAWARENEERIAALRSYHRSAGEAESRNLEDRRKRGYNYLIHPRDTADVLPGLLDVYRTDPGYPVGWLTKPTKRADGGGIPFNVEKSGARQLVRNGMLNSKVPGRTDKLNIKVPSGSYVIPADVVSGLGQGNTMGGAAIMQKMFSQGPAGSSTGPLGMPAGIKSRGSRGTGHAARIGTTKLPKGSKTTATLDQTFADGGPTGHEMAAEEHVGEPTPIDAAGGEYLVHPAVVRRLGRGDLKKGHEVLDAFVLHARDQIIKQMQDLKPPVKSTHDEGGGDDMSEGADYYKAITGGQP